MTAICLLLLSILQAVWFYYTICIQCRSEGYGKKHPTNGLNFILKGDFDLYPVGWLHIVRIKDTYSDIVNMTCLQWMKYLKFCAWMYHLRWLIIQLSAHFLVTLLCHHQHKWAEFTVWYRYNTVCVCCYIASID